MKTKYIMDTMNTPIIALVGLFLFAALAYYSMQPCVKYPLADACVEGIFTPQNVGYSRVELQRRSDEINAILYPDNRKQIMEVWNLTEADVAKPVNLWGAK